MCSGQVVQPSRINSGCRQDYSRCGDILAFKFLKVISLGLQATNSPQCVNVCMGGRGCVPPLRSTELLFLGVRQAPSLLRFSRFASPAFCDESQPIPPFQIPLTSFFSSYHNNFSRVKVSCAGIPHVGVWSLLDGVGLMAESGLGEIWS